MGGARLLVRVPAPVRHAYTLAVVLVTWVFFRAATLPEASHFVTAMLGGGAYPSATTSVALFLDNERTLALLAGVIGSTPWLLTLRGRAPQTTAGLVTAQLARAAGLAVVFVAATMRLSSGTYNPFIYFRF
jgi:alginate O-acetyltransferase complex protein AlgI